MEALDMRVLEIPEEFDIGYDYRFVEYCLRRIERHLEENEVMKAEPFVEYLDGQNLADLAEQFKISKFNFGIAQSFLWDELSPYLWQGVNNEMPRL